MKTNIYGKVLHLLFIFTPFVLSSCDYWIFRDLAGGILKNGLGDTIKWQLKYECWNDINFLKFESKGRHQFGIHRVDSGRSNGFSQGLEVYEDSLKVSFFDTLKVGVLDVKIEAGKVDMVNSDTASRFRTPLLFSYLPKARKAVYMKISPCGYLKYDGKNLINDTIVIKWMRPWRIIR